jgi:WD40 repeat protein
LLAGYAGTPLAVAYSPDGSSLLTGDARGEARLWNARITEDLRVIARYPGPVARAVFVHGGTRVFSFDERGDAAHIRSADDGRVLRTFRLPAIVAGDATRDGERVVLGSANGTVVVRDGRGRVLAHFEHPSVRLVKLSPAGTTVATASADGSVRVQAIRAGARALTIRPGAPVTDLAFEGPTLAVAGEDGVVRLFDGRDGSQIATLRGHEGPVVRVRFSPRHDVIATGGDDRTVRLWTPRGEPLRVLRAHTGAVTDLAFDHDGGRLATSSEGDGANAIVWDVASGRRIQALVGHFGTVGSIGFSGDDRWVVTAGPITAGVWPVATGQLLFYLRGHEGLLTGAMFSPTRHWILTSGRDGTVRTYDCDVCRPLDELVALARRRLDTAAARP